MSGPILAKELRGPAADQPLQRHEAWLRVFGLFAVVVLGIVSSWFWGIGWNYVGDPAKGLQAGPLGAIAVRVILSFIAAFLTFVPIYDKVNQNTSEAWTPWLLAFQNGFFWQYALASIAKQFQG